MRWLLVALLAVSCSPEPPAVVESPPSPLVTELPEPGSTPRARRYQDIAQIRDQLGGCEVESLHPGADPTLKARATCFIGSTRWVIWHMTRSTAPWRHVMEGMASIEGPGWIVVSLSGEQAALYAHSKLGGTLQLP